MLDFLISGGAVVDGSGRPAFAADVGVQGDRIAVIGDLQHAEARTVIDAKGMIVTPGFVDIHTHSDASLLADPRAESQIRQGVTTEVIGQCGISLAPCTDETRTASFAKLGFADGGNWRSYGEMLEAMDEARPATNVVGMVGHGALREIVMGSSAPRPATEQEVAKMARLLEIALDEGAAGMTSGLEYHPGKMAEHDEMAALGRVVANVDGLYSTHSRNRDTRYFEAFAEAINVARASGVRLQISHINPKYGRPDPAMRNTLQMIDSAREEGIDVAMDMMPCNWNHTAASALLPTWSHALSRTELLQLLKTKDGRQRLQVNPQPIWQLAADERWDRVRLLDVPEGAPYRGHLVADVARQRNTSGWDVIFDVMLDAGEAYTGVFLASEAFAEEDNRLVLSHPLCAVESDTMALANDGVLKGRQVGLHGYNWAARFISHYLRDEEILSLEQGVRRLTSLPASRVGLRARGLLSKGYAADIAVFTLSQVSDNASFADPTTYAGGFEHVLVNGVLTYSHGKRTPDRAGRVLRRD